MHWGMAPLLVLENVDKHFGDLHVLKGISTSVDKGEVVVVIGPSGSGKSTLCRAINRLETIDSGTISIDGVPLPEEGTELAQLRADVGMVFQSFNLFAHKTILENVTLGQIKVRKRSKAEAEKRAVDILDRVGVANQAAKLPAQLSGGQQQRVAIARSLVHNPRLIICDEPTASLDAKNGTLVMEIFRETARHPGSAALVVTHDNRIFKYADRIARMDDGRIIDIHAAGEQPLPGDSVTE